MSTLGTFAKYSRSANFADEIIDKKKAGRPKKSAAVAPVEAVPTPRVSRAEQRIAENNAKQASSLSRFDPKPAPIVPTTLSDDAAKTAATLKPDSGLKQPKSSADVRKAITESRNKVNGQKSIEGVADELGFRKSVKTLANDVTAVGGVPERKLIAKGKASEGFGKTLAEGAEKFGKLGYREGAIGARGLLNKVVGRTFTGKAVRLGAAGAGIAAIGSVLSKKNKNEE